MRGVANNAEQPAVQAEDEVEDPPRIAPVKRIAKKATIVSGAMAAGRPRHGKRASLEAMVARPAGLA